MLVRRDFMMLLSAMMLLATEWSHATAADKEAKNDGGKVAGILIDKKDNWITVKAEGDDEPAKYVIDASDKKLQQAFVIVHNSAFDWTCAMGDVRS